MFFINLGYKKVRLKTTFIIFFINLYKDKFSYLLVQRAMLISSIANNQFMIKMFVKYDLNIHDYIQ